MGYSQLLVSPIFFVSLGSWNKYSWNKLKNAKLGEAYQLASRMT